MCYYRTDRRANAHNRMKTEVEKVYLQPLLSFQHHPVHQQDLEGREVPEDQSNLLDQNLLCLPRKVSPVSHLHYLKQPTGHMFVLFASYPLSEDSIFARRAVGSCRALRTREKTLRRLQTSEADLGGVVAN